jgi:hypothetical protein
MTRNDNQYEKRCVICGSKQGRITRGLCSAHYLKLQSHLRKLTPEGVAALEDRLMAEGKLLPPDVAGKKARTPDPFIDTVSTVVQENPDAYLAEGAHIDTEHSARKTALDRKAIAHTKPRNGDNQKSKPKKNSG